MSDEVDVPHEDAEISSPPETGAKRRWTRRRFLALGVVGATASVCVPYRFGCYVSPEAFHQLENLSKTQGSILAGIVDAMLPPDADRSPERLEEHVTFIDSYLTGLPSSDIGQLGGLLYLMEHLTLPFGPHLRRFSRLDREARADYLRGWQRSRFGLRRLGLNSLKTLVFLSYYSRADAFASIGYSGPIAPGFEGPPASRERYERLLAPAGSEPPTLAGSDMELERVE